MQTYIQTKSPNAWCRRAAASAAAAVVVIASVHACGPTGDGVDEASSALNPADKGPQIANHPRFASVSQHANGLLGGVAAAIATMSASRVQQLRLDLESCDPATSCEPLFRQSFGYDVSELQSVVASLAQIQTDLGLDTATDTERENAFRYAEFLVDGDGAQSTILNGILPNANFACHATRDCPEQLGSDLGTTKAEFLVNLAFVAIPPGRDALQSRAGSISSPALAPVVVAAIIAAAVPATVKLIEWSEDRIYNSDEEEKDCHVDDDCEDDGEFCHKFGDNDCRPKRSQGALCGRDTQCESNCCKWHWFVRQCRPSSKCN